jgi:hypothetical protein
MQAERRLERSRNVTTAAVPLTEANATAFILSVRDGRAFTPQRNARWSWRAVFALCASFPRCAEIAQARYFLSTNLCGEKVIVIADCAQGDAICSNKCAIILS